MQQSKLSKSLRVIGMGLAFLLGAATAAQADDVGAVNSRFSAADTTYYDDSTLTLQAKIEGTNVVLVEGDSIDDIFDENTRVTQVVVTIEAPRTGESIVVTALSGPTWTEQADDSWQATFAMPDAGECTTGSFGLAEAGGAMYDPIVRLKRKIGGVTPTCSGA
ncbi:hypothetical protein ENSA5_05100 [Enhygromyxa salina]|uniref:Uncharacterized protein n=1 Tax=Enhygromyxa salina TaxID=215803 RepID=A0A2S9YI05_9BACT|nr:hypothetical protein [Enhygromyxa salina]PRQ04745.1 hypothetical protein ENSA5_05100 [Enhygromyxa salina]